MKPTPLPIDLIVPEIVQALEKGNNAVVVAQPGAGKTTRVPPALLSSEFAKGKEIWVLQPRRLAAKLAAIRVAEELGEKPGQQVGYQFRFEKCVTAQTRLRFLTDGMLLPLAQADPEFKQVAAIILDEFHERSLELDLSLAWLRRLQLTTRPDLRLLVMSATLDSETLSTYLSNAPVFNSEGRVFPIHVEFMPQPEQHDLSLKVKSAIRHLSHKGIQGTTLVFLPGLGEIKQCLKALSQEKAEVHALYGALSVEEQQEVLKPTSGNKIILTTNVAETSLTVPGVTAVVDSGLTRQSRVSGWSGLQSLVTVPASQASAAQRAGRAGRLQEGTCLRLFTKFDFDHRAAFDLPELLRADLSKSLLDLLNLGVTDFKNFPWFLTPSEVSFSSALTLLKRLGAVNHENRLTETGRRMANLPLAPRIARFLLETEKHAGSNPMILRQACRLATYISEEKMGAEDLLEDLRRYQPGYEASKLDEKLAGLLKVGHLSANKPDTQAQSALAIGLLAAFPDRVAQIRPQNKKELLLSEGGTAMGSDEVLLRHHDYFVVVEAQEVTYGGRHPKEAAKTQVKARSLCPIEETWLLDLFPDDLKDETTCQWNNKAQRVEGFKRLQYGQLILDEKILGTNDWPPEGQALLLKEALSAGPQAYCDPEELQGFLNRVRFVGERAKNFPIFNEEFVEKTLAELCQTCRSFNDLKEANLVAALRAQLAPQEQALMDRLAPAQIALAAGRRVTIHYDQGKPPWAESRIQDFFGMKKGPTVGGGEVPIVLHLLSPRQQPLQVTGDLAGFWVNHYPQIRKEMMRRYPRHKWPENP
ncbi:MAG TPA: ATP-dependent helicase HrpB [bacterium]|nr:ATP-dependent helicase HrpB [bacterium]